jgi:hypothetical protein
MVEKSINLNKEYYLELAKKEDFESIRNDERFKALITSYREEKGK